MNMLIIKHKGLEKFRLADGEHCPVCCLKTLTKEGVLDHPPEHRTGPTIEQEAPNGAADGG